ncbi:MAG: copper homeostasis protein CutC [Planctomycetales bacterium]|nr:copper homeostasis protein CutC [Planctomycetales bacterium]
MLEVCVGSLADAQAAAKAGADRLELCSALELGGLTPSLALVEQVLGEVDLPVFVMARPRGGGFCYSSDETRCMRRDAELALAAGASGIVFGFLNASGEVDAVRTGELVRLAGAQATVFHRAFDFVPNRSVALDELIDQGVKRVLTTGGATTAMDGADSLRRLIIQAKGRIEILPGGGVTAANIADIVALSGCNQIHAGASKGAIDDTLSAYSASSLCDLDRLSAGERRVVDKRLVAELVEELSCIPE